MSFDNPVVGGTSLRIPAIQSPNFSMGPPVAGWSIQQNGNAYFGNVTISGEYVGTDFIIDDSGIFFYSGAPATGNLVVSIAAVAGTDAYGNTYPSGFSLSGGGRSVVLGLTGGSPLEYFVTGLAATMNSAAIQALVQGSGTSAYDFLQILSAEDTTQKTLMLIGLGGASADGTTVPEFTVQYKDASNTFHTEFQVSPTGVAVNLPLTVDEEIIQMLGNDNNPLIGQFNTVVSTQGFILQQHAATGSFALRLQVSGDTDDRFNLAAAGQHQWGPGGSAAIDTKLQRIGAGALALTNNLLIGSTTNLGDNGVGELKLANAATVPSTNPAAGGVLYADQGVPSWRDTGGNLLGMVRAYQARATGNLTSWTTETDIPGATVQVVITGTNATVQIAAFMDVENGTTASLLVTGMLNWNGTDQASDIIFNGTTLSTRVTVGQVWTITGVTAGTYTAKLRATCATAGAANEIRSGGTGMNVLVIDQ